MKTTESLYRAMDGKLLRAIADNAVPGRFVDAVTRRAALEEISRRAGVALHDNGIVIRSFNGAVTRYTADGNAITIQGGTE
jgi:hypothetical protein